MMKITALNENERLALMGLLKMVIQADRRLSPEELAELNRLAEEMGQEKWAAAKSQAAEQFKALNQIRVYLETGVERAAAKELLYDLAKQMAGADEDDPLEESVIRWLARIWNIRA